MICDRSDIFDGHGGFPRCVEAEFKSHLTFHDVDDLGIEFEYAYWMAKDQQPRTADEQWTIKSGTNAGIADILADSMEGLSVGDKIDVKAARNAGRPIFEFANAVRT